MAREKLILVNQQSPGDVVVLTAAVRDLHVCYPGRFVTDVRTRWPDLWRYNPHVSPLAMEDREARLVICRYPLVDESNERPVHYLHGFVEDLNRQLGLQIRPTGTRGDLYLSAEERERRSPVGERVGREVPYWIVNAGGKFDMTIKWWQVRRWQEVVDRFRGELLFVQVGDRQHYHPPLSGVLDLRGQLGLRELMRLVYRAQGVACPITFLMHLAAAVECPPGAAANRPCVVVAGGREPAHWAAYATHQFLHTVGALPCCATGGCWRCRTVPLGDGHLFDQPQYLCADVAGGLPRCMDLITVERVVSAIRLYLDGGGLPRLTAAEVRALGPVLAPRPFSREILRRSRTRRRAGQQTRKTVERKESLWTQRTNRS